MAIAIYITIITVAIYITINVTSKKHSTVDSDEKLFYKMEIRILCHILLIRPLVLL